MGAATGPLAGAAQSGSAGRRLPGVCTAVREGDTQFSAAREAGVRGAGEGGGGGPAPHSRPLAGGRRLRPMPAAPPEPHAARLHDFKVTAILLTCSKLGLRVCRLPPPRVRAVGRSE